MKKYFSFMLVLVLLTFFVNTTLVEAKACSGVLQAPDIPQIYSNQGHHVTLKTDSDSCYGSNTEVWFSNIQNLPADYPTHGGQMMTAYLYEEDPPGNPDEIVKQYLGVFSGRVMYNLYLSKTITPGLIDSTGDQYCELYMDYSMSGTIGGPVLKKLLNYQMCMK